MTTKQSEIIELLNLAKDCIVNRRYESAYNILISVVKKNEQCAEAYFLLSRMASDIKNVDKEIDFLTQALSIQPENPEYNAFLARAYAVKGDTDKCIEYINRASLLDEQTSLSLDTIGNAYNRLNLYKEASTFFQRATLLDTKSPSIYFNLGSTLKFCGDFNGARQSFETAIKLNPKFYKAHAALTTLGGITSQNNHVHRLTGLLPPITNPDDLLHICHALSKEYEALNDYDSAFYFLELAKKNKLAATPYDINTDIKMFADLKSTFANMKSTTSNYHTDRNFIFVVGMPRTGTTLVERIISNSSDVATGGELHHIGQITKQLVGNQVNSLIDSTLIKAAEQVDYAKLAERYEECTSHFFGEKKYLIDKLPLNVLYAGFIARAFPNAKIVCLDRNPLDSIMSNYRQLFSFSDFTYRYTLSLETTAKFYIEFKSLIEFWKETLPNNFHTVNYEKLVKDPTSEARKMIEFCGLPWNESCLSIEKNTNPVATASSVQVRGSISDKSIGQWKNYKKYTAEVELLLSNAGL